MARNPTPRPKSGLVSLVSVQGRNLVYTDEIEEAVEIGEMVGIANIHAVFMQVVENMVGCQKRLGEYPTILDKKGLMPELSIQT